MKPLDSAPRSARPREGENPCEGGVLFRNEACVLINKKPGASSEAPAFGAAGEGFFPVHRLDMPVSGCLLFGLTREAAAFLSAAFSGRGGEGRIEKRYWAVIEKPPPGAAFTPEAELVHWLYEDRKANKSYALPWRENPPSLKGRSSPPPKKAVLRYTLAGEGERYLFLEIDLVTGRHHQIRAQLAALDLHVKGDLKYGAKRSEKGGGIRLHARSLAFPNPLNRDETIRAEASPPLMDALWTAFPGLAAAEGGSL